MNPAEKLQICKAVAQAILADGQVTDSEHNFITRLMNKYDLNEEQRKDVMNRNMDDDPATLVNGITSFESQNELMVELVMAVAADNELTKSERQLLNTVAVAIGVDPADMDMLVKTALM